MIVPNFLNVRTGTIVKRSAHWFKERGITVKSREIGIIVGIDHYGMFDATGKLVNICAWPTIHWEGCIGPSGCHPCNVELCRRDDRDRAGRFDYDDTLELRR